MATALTLIDDAFDDIEVKSAETALTATEQAKGLRYLNRLMAEFEVRGLDVNYVTLAAVADETNIPIWMEDCVIAWLAIRLAPAFGVEISGALIGAAEEAMDSVRRRLVRINRPNYPASLPIGSGNYQLGYSSRFYRAPLPDLDINGDPN